MSELVLGYKNDLPIEVIVDLPTGYDEVIGLHVRFVIPEDRSTYAVILEAIRLLQQVASHIRPIPDGLTGNEPMIGGR